MSNEPERPANFKPELSLGFRYTHQFTKMALDEKNDLACGVKHTHLFTSMISDTSVSPTCTRYCQACEPGVCSKWATCYEPGNDVTAKCRECLNPPGCTM